MAEGPEEDHSCASLQNNMEINPRKNTSVLSEQGAMFLLLDFPKGSEFGIDYSSWTVGPNFRGIKMIPPGIHFIYYSSCNSDGQNGPRAGFFYNFSKKEIVVRKWDKLNEDIKKEPITEEEMQRFHDNKREMDRFVGPYPYERFKQWFSLTNHISKETLHHLQPDCGFVSAVAQFESESSTTQSRQASSTRGGNLSSALPKEQADLPVLKRIAGTDIKYSLIPKQKYPDGATPAEITKYSMDGSYSLDLLIAQRYNSIENVLGEIQFAFICFLIGQNYDSFEQWKNLVHLLCTSGDAIISKPKAYISFISLLFFEIREIPSDFFVDIVTSNNFLTLTLHELFTNVDCEDVDPELRKKGLSFRKHLTEKFNWDFTSEPEEYAPVVVDCS